MSEPPSERFILVQRGFTFLDEWLFYLLLTFLHINDYAIFYLVAPIGITMIVYSYVRLWKMESRRFGPSE